MPHRLLAFGAATIASTAIWLSAFILQPSFAETAPRWGHIGHVRGQVSTYDSQRHRLVFVGGRSFHGRSDVRFFSLSDRTWSTALTIGEGPEPFACDWVAYDPRGDRVIAGGTKHNAYDGRYQAGVWELTLGEQPRWEKLNTRSYGGIGEALAVDTRRNQIIIYGGYTCGSHCDIKIRSSRMNAFDLDSNTWTTVGAPGAPQYGHYGHSMIYDAGRDRLIVYAGHKWDARNRRDVLVDEVWEVPLSGAGRQWRFIPPQYPPPLPRNGAAAVYDPIRDQMLMWGGGYAEAWGLDLSDSVHASWTRIASPVTGGKPIYNPVDENFVVVSGTTIGALDLEPEPTWTEIDREFVLGKRGDGVYDEAADRMVVLPGDGDPSVWALDLETDKWTQLDDFLDLWPYGSVYDSEADQIVVCDSREGALRVWTMPSGGSTFTQVATTGDVPNRNYFATVFNPNDHSLIVYGGGYTRNDTWKLDLGTMHWSEIVPDGPRPVSTYFPYGMFDPSRNRLFVWGGLDTLYWRNDSWALDLSGTPRWGQVDANRGTWRKGRALVYDPARDEFVYAGVDVQSSSDPLEISRRPADLSSGWRGYGAETNGPMERGYPTFVYDSKRDRFILMGGSHGSTDIWVLYPEHRTVPRVLNRDVRYAQGAVTLEWETDDIAVSGHVLRREVVEGATWRPIGSAATDGEFYITYVDRATLGGRRYEYRFAYNRIDDIAYTPTLTVDVGVHVENRGTSMSEEGVRARWFTNYPELVATAAHSTDQVAWVEIGEVVPDTDGEIEIVHRDPEPGTVYYYRLHFIVDGWDFFTHPTWVEWPEESLFRFGLAAIRPNPARDRVEVVFTLPQRGSGSLDVLDLAGRLVRTTPIAPFGPGEHVVPLILTSGPGIYFVRLSYDGLTATRRVVVLGR